MGYLLTVHFMEKKKKKKTHMKIMTSKYPMEKENFKEIYHLKTWREIFH